MNFIRRYLMVILVGISLLFGIQIPNFLDQYEKRIDAHLREVTKSLQSYQVIAAKYNNNNILDLIASHKSNANPAFRDEGFAIESMLQRKQRFEQDQLAITDGTFSTALRIMIAGDKEILKETMAQYSYAVPLNRDAVISGATIAVLIALFIEMLFGVMGFAISKARNRKQQQKIHIQTAGAPKKVRELLG